MQTPKTKPGSVPQRKSLANPTTQIARRLSSEADLAMSPNKQSRTPKSSPKVLNRRSPRSPMSEKKHPSRTISELESQLGLAQREAEQAKCELRAVSQKLAESEKQLSELAESEDDRIEELRKLSKERDKVWESELEAVRRQQSMDSSTAMAEVLRLKAQLERATDSEESAHGLARRLRDSEARVKSLEGLVGKLQAEMINVSEGELVRELRAELGSVKSEVVELRSTLDAAEVRYQEEFIRSTLQIRSACEEAERTRAESAGKEAQIEELKALVMEKERELSESECSRQRVCEENENRKAVEVELRRVKVQADQWRKAAEVAASILSTENGYDPMPMVSPSSAEDMDDYDDDSPKSKNGNVLKKIGVLWKKNHK